jgi:gas vesicle protein
MAVDNQNQEHTGYGFMVGMLCGVAVGAALGVLFAPSEGKVLRGKIGESARQISDQSKDMYDSARRAVNDAVTSGREAFQKTRGETAGADA